MKSFIFDIGALSCEYRIFWKSAYDRKSVSLELAPPPFDVK